jgi:hypothetical protein
MHLTRQLLVFGVGKPVGVGSGFDDGSLEREPVNDRRAEAGVREGFGSAGE